MKILALNEKKNNYKVSFLQIVLKYNFSQLNIYYIIYI